MASQQQQPRKGGLRNGARCCLCGSALRVVNQAAMCEACLAAEITGEGSGLPSTGEVYQCRSCRRWKPLQGHHYLDADFESPELLALCLRQIKILRKEELEEAAFVWTEPHSMRLKVRVKVRREVLDSKLVVQQSQVVEFEIKWKQCPECARDFNNQTWKAVVQVRQKLEHTRSLLYLEQKILSSGMQKDTLDIQVHNHGFDFFFPEKGPALKMCEWFSSNTVCQIEKSSKLISTDNHSNITHTKFSMLVNIVPLARGDAVVMPKGLGGKLQGKLCLVDKLTSVIHFLDPLTGETAEVTPARYFKSTFGPLLTTSRLTEFFVLDIEPTDPVRDASKSHDGFVMADAEVAREDGALDKTYLISTHLGRRLAAGDTALGYDFEGATNVDDEITANFPDVILVKKKRIKSKKASKNDKSLRRQRLGGGKTTGEEAPSISRKGGRSGARTEDLEHEFEAFMAELEGDEELRAQLGLPPEDAPKNLLQEEQGEEDYDQEHVVIS